jgi:hypothetical protein
VSEKIILALFSKSPYALKPWADAGYTCVNIDIDNEEGWLDGQEYVSLDLSEDINLAVYLAKNDLEPALVVCFGPCDDLAGCGAKHFAKKRAKDPDFQDKAIKLFSIGERLAKSYNCPCLSENPVGRVSTLYRKPELIISPEQYGGYLPEDDEHPEWPEYIAPRDAYRKKTCYWLLNGMDTGPKKPVPLFDTGVDTYLGRQGNSKQFLKLGGKSEKTKTIRSLTPRGVFISLYHAMKGKIS